LSSFPDMQGGRGGRLADVVVVFELFC